MAEEKTSDRCGCGCSGGSTLIFACSGAADVGQLADLAARRLTAEGAGKMFCLAGIGGQVRGIVETTRAASAVLAIDGCPLDCARLTLEQAGFDGVAHLRLTDLGIEKGRSPATPEQIDRVVAEAKTRLQGCP